MANLKMNMAVGLTAILFFASSPAALADTIGAAAEEDGSCLLAKKKVMGKLGHMPGTETSALSVSAKHHRGWRAQHAQRHRALNESSGSLEAYIQEQEATDDACSARLAESKRALDGLLHDINTLSDQVEAHEEVLETEAENMKISNEAIAAIEAAYEEEVAECEQLRQAARDDLALYESEREELRQIANPDVRYEYVASETPPPPEEVMALAQTWSKTSCMKFKDFMQKHPQHRKLHEHKKVSVVQLTAATKQEPNETAVETELSCDEQREKLQEVFTETWNIVDHLIEDATDRIEDDSCFQAATDKKTAELVPQVAAREQAAGRMETSSAALAQLEPVLELVKNHAEALEEHISDTLTPECEEVAALSETLKDVRELILSLEKCPGRHDFVLEIPEETPAAEESAAESAEELAGEEEEPAGENASDVFIPPTDELQDAMELIATDANETN